MFEIDGVHYRQYAYIWPDTVGRTVVYIYTNEIITPIKRFAGDTPTVLIQQWAKDNRYYVLKCKDYVSW